MAAIPLGAMMAASAAVSAVGAIQQGMAAQAQGKAAQDAANYNAILKQQQSALELQQAGAREEQARRASRQVLGQQRAALAQAGVGLGGSALDIMEQSADRAELDALTMRYEGDLRSKGLLAAAEGARYEGRVARAAGENAMKGAYLSAGASLLSAAGSYKYYSAGMPRADVVSAAPTIGGGGLGFTGTGRLGLRT
jgi:Xaa-Pro aminopeptidase